METEIKELKAKLSEAENRACEAEENMMKAAEAGRELCEKLTQVESQRDELMQERHSLKQLLEHKTALETSYAEEIESLKDCIEKMREKHQNEMSKTMSQLEASEKSCKSKDFNLESTINQKETEIENLRHKITLLEEIAAEKNVDTSMLNDSNGATALVEEVAEWKQKFSELKSHYVEMTRHSEELTLQNENLRNEVHRLKEVIEEKDAELLSCVADVRQMQAENPLMEEVDIDIDIGASKGNSLFSEVEDRRLLVEDRLKKYKSHLEELKNVCDAKSRLIAKLRAQNVALSTMASSGGDLSSNLHRLEELLALKTSENQSLRAKNTELEAKMATKTVLPSAGNAQSQRRQTAFMKQPSTASCTGQANSTSLDDIQRQLQSQIRHSLQCEEMVRDVNRENAVLETKNKKLTAEVYRLKLKVQELAEKVPGLDGVEKSAPSNVGFEKITEKLDFGVEESHQNAANLLPDPNFKEIRTSSTTDLADPVFNEFKKKEVPCAVDNEGESKESKIFKRKIKGQKKSVRFDEQETVESAAEVKENVAENSPPKKSFHKHENFIDAEVESKKLEEQCTQQ